MDNLQRAMMGAPSIHADIFDPRCCICGISGHIRHLESHHVVYRSQGGANGPTIDVCSAGGNALYDANGGMTCHGALHHHYLSVNYADGRWWYLWTSEPTRFDKALQMDGWKPIHQWGEICDEPVVLPF